VSYGYRSAGLSDICMAACIAFELVNTSGVRILIFVSKLLIYCVCGPECYLQVSSLE